MTPGSGRGGRAATFCGNGIPPTPGGTGGPPGLPEAAAREAADRATTGSGVGSLKAEAGRILAAYPDALSSHDLQRVRVLQGIEARNHAATLRDKAVITVKRK